MKTWLTRCPATFILSRIKTGFSQNWHVSLARDLKRVDVDVEDDIDFDGVLDSLDTWDPDFFGFKLDEWNAW